MKKLFILLIAGVLASQVGRAQKINDYVVEKWNGTGWENYYRMNYTYDAAMNQLTQTYQMWDGSAWQNAYLYANSNDANGNPTITTNQQWVSASSTWSNASRALYTYTQTKILTWLNETWNGTAYQNSYRFDYTYDANLFLQTQTLKYWNGTVYNDNSMTTFSNNAAGASTLQLSQTWNTTASTWSNSLLITNTYTQSKPLLMNNETWDGSAWQPYYRFSYAYDASMYLLSMHYEHYSGGWVNSQLHTYSNSASGSPTLMLTQTWNAAASTWSNNTRHITSYLATKPVVSTTSVSAVSTTSAICSGDVSGDGGDLISTRGICYSTLPNPTTNDPKVSAGTGTGSFSVDITGLGSSTWYFVRAYATNTAGTTYGNNLSFKTDTVIVSDTTALSEQRNNAGFRLFPQPASDVVYAVSDLATNCTVFDAAGREVMAVKIAAGKTPIDISKLPAGIYYLREKGGPTIRFIKQ